MENLWTHIGVSNPMTLAVSLVIMSYLLASASLLMLNRCVSAVEVLQAISANTCLSNPRKALCVLTVVVYASLRVLAIGGSILLRKNIVTDETDSLLWKSVSLVAGAPLRGEKCRSTKQGE